MPMTTIDPEIAQNPGKGRRNDWVDNAKGIGIVFVVAGHAINGLAAASVFDTTHPLNVIYYLIYTFHMPLFFVLSGLYVERRVNADRASFLQSLMTRIAWPYLLWSVVQLGVIAMLGDFVNVPTSFTVERAVSLLWKPTSQFWYLHTLLLLHLSSYLLIPSFGVIVTVILFISTIGIPTLVPVGALAGPLSYGVFYALGVLIGRSFMARTENTRSDVSIAMICIPVFIVSSIACFHEEFSYKSVEAYPAALSAIWIVITVSRSRLANQAPFLALLGRASLAIFILHVLFVAGSRIVLVKFLHVDSPYLLLICLTLAGVGGPFLLFKHLRRFKTFGALGLG